ncbi:MAG TPA: hypothetical protein VF409_05430 [Sphingomonas sp.]
MRHAGTRLSTKRRAVGPARMGLRSRILSLLMLTAIFGALALGAAMLIFILRDLWVFMVSMMQR